MVSVRPVAWPKRRQKCGSSSQISCRSGGFLADTSYGFRPGRGAHNALDALAVGVTRRKINWVVDCDIRAFFDTVSRDWLVRFLEHRIGDKRVIRLIIKWLNAGVMEAGEWQDNLRGTPQGSVASPILANIYLHYVLDLWFQKKWRSHEVNGCRSLTDIKKFM